MIHAISIPQFSRIFVSFDHEQMLEVNRLSTLEATTRLWHGEGLPGVSDRSLMIEDALLGSYLTFSLVFRSKYLQPEYIVYMLILCIHIYIYIYR